MAKIAVDQIQTPELGAPIFRVSIAAHTVADSDQANRLADQLEDMGLSPIVQVGELRVVWRTVRRNARRM